MISSSYNLTHLKATRGREHPHHPRGSRRVRAAGDALLNRQGLRRHAAAGAEGVPPRTAALPTAARRYDLEVPGDDRVPRSVSVANRAST